MEHPETQQQGTGHPHPAGALLLLADLGDDRPVLYLPEGVTRDGFERGLVVEAGQHVQQDIGEGAVVYYQGQAHRLGTWRLIDERQVLAWDDPL